ncbi:hypothetical protein LTR93_008197 [Exophiala xenobiotica]|nr:hypothetical protein LTR93_008197 [Exophiala xenobiotica]
MGDSGTVRALNASAPKHAWTSADREFLGVTHRLYDITNIELTQIFNTLNDDRLQQEGFRNGLKTTAISSQVADLKRTDRGGVFQDVLSMSTFNVQNRFGELIINIEQAAATLDIALPARSGGTAATVSVTRRLPKARLDEWATESEPSISPPAPNPVAFELNPPKRRRIVATPSPSTSPAYTGSSFTESQSPTTIVTYSNPRSSSTSDVDSNSIGSWKTDSDSDGGEEHLDINDNDFPATASRINPRLKISFNHKRKSAPQRPRLLFRAFDPTHGLTARQFLHSPQEVPSPPTMDTHEFRDMAFRHLSFDENFQSPFLSWTESAFRALELIAKSASPLSLAIVDYNVYEDAQEGRLGKATGLWLFLSWASITCETIAILDTAAATKLYQTMHYIGELSNQSGVLVSQCLNDVRPIYREVVAYKLLKNFKVLRRSQGSSGASYEAFMDGLYGTASADIIVVESGSRMITQDGINLSQQGPILPVTSEGVITVDIPSSSNTTRDRKPSALTCDAPSIDEDVIQALVDAQLSATCNPFGIIVVPTDDGVDGLLREPIAELQMTFGTQLAEEDAHLESRCGIPDNACSRDTTLYPTEEDYPTIKAEPEPEAIFMKELRETANMFTPPLPSVDTSIDIAKDDSETSLKATFEENKNIIGTKPMKSASTSETKRSVVKVANKIDVSKLFDRHRASLLARADYAASTSATGPSQSNVPMADTRHPASVIDLTNDAGTSVRSLRPKKHQTTFGPRGNEECLNAVDLTTDAGQDSTSLTMPSNTQSGGEETNNVDTTTFTTDADPDLHEVLDTANDDDIQIIGTATVRRRHRVRTTVLTVRSRSVSESLTFAAGATPHPRGKQS